ncbi:MAG: hypothetical protein NTY04_02195 [Candidatus Staskawiczbacteria bacterium]|nr:hypothetical protein [Candidatus Staskawiczbacteria bacterium]
MKKTKTVFREIVGTGKCPKRKGDDSRHGFVPVSLIQRAYKSGVKESPFCIYKCRFCKLKVEVPIENALKIEEVAKQGGHKQ